MPRNRNSDLMLEAYLRDIQEYPRITKQKEIELGKIIEKGDKNNGYDKAVNDLVHANLKLVVGCAKRYVDRGLDFMELISAGNAGLMRAVTKYKASFECRFSTHAVHWIVQAIRRELANQSRTIRIPVWGCDKFFEIRKKEEKFLQEYGRKPSIEELSALTSIPAGVLSDILRCQNTASLDKQIRDDSLAYFIEEEQEEESFYLKEKRNSLKKAVSKLTKQQAMIILARFGLNKEERKYKLREIGEEMGLTRERIRQIEKAAKIRLGIPQNAKSLVDLI